MTFIGIIVFFSWRKLHTWEGYRQFYGFFLVGSGQQTYSVIDVDDYAEMILRLAQQILRGQHEDQKTGKAFNVGYRQPLSLSEIITSICETMGLAQPKKKIPIHPSFLFLILHREYGVKPTIYI